MGEQRRPQVGREDVTERLIAHLRERQEKGRATYGRSLETFNGRDAGRDALEELLDASQYQMQQDLEREALHTLLRRIRGLVQGIGIFRESTPEAVCREVGRMLDEEPVVDMLYPPGPRTE